MNDIETRRLAFLFASEAEGLAYPPDCPFKTARTGMTLGRLKSFGLIGGSLHQLAPARKATSDELLRIHKIDYLKELQRAAGGDLTVAGLHMGLGQTDSPVFKDMYEYGAWACGAGLSAADLLIQSKVDIAFNLMGGFHHAHPAKAGGFCYLNDVALACDHLARAGMRVACVDLDAHHGDGTQSIFYDRDDVFTFSMHESGKTLYPWGGFEEEIGRGDGTGCNANLSLPAGTFDEAFVSGLDQALMPLLKSFDPEVIVLELGMDILSGDPLTHLRMTNNVVVEVFNRLLPLGLPLLVTGGGGYHLENTVRGWALAWRTCCGTEEAEEAGFGGVMLASSEWAGGLRDRVLPVAEDQRWTVESQFNHSLHKLRASLAPHHLLPESGVIGLKA